MLGRAALEEKVAIEYNGDASRVTNIVSGNILYDSEADLRRAPPLIVEAMREQQIEVVRIVDRWTAPLIDGYRDILLNLRMPNGHITETQLHLRALVDARRRMSDGYTEQWWINHRRLKEDRPFTRAEARRILELLDQQARMYARAARRA